MGKVDLLIKNDVLTQQKLYFVAFVMFNSMIQYNETFVKCPAPFLEIY